MPQARSYRGVAPADRVAQRRRAVIDAALDCLHEDGLAGFSVRSVCSRARLTARYFYESFTDLDALLLAVVDTVCAEVAAQALAAIAEAGESLEAKIRAAVASAFAVLSEDPRKGSAFLLASAGPEALHDKREEWLTEFVGLVLANLAVHAEPSLQGRRAARGAALFVMGGTSEMLRAVLGGSLAMTADDVVNRLTAMWVAALDA